MKIVWTNGCFDILHIGHIRLFKHARSLGDRLIVGIDSDSRVGKLKGADRPINSQDHRKELLLSNKYVDEVVIFNSEKDLIETIKNHHVHTMVVGEEYRNKKVIGQEEARAVEFFKRVEGVSTTNILGKTGAR